MRKGRPQTERGRGNAAPGAAAAVGAAISIALALAAGPAAASEPVSVEAGTLSYSKDGQVLSAEDDVRIIWRDNVLSADAVTVEQEKTRLISSGGLVLETPEVLLNADSCEIDYESETGELINVDVIFKDRPGGFGGDRIRKLPGRRYSLDDGYYTTCDTTGDGPPEWELAGQEVEVELDGYGRLRGGAFRVNGVPILYVPYAVFPTLNRRQTGVLLPRIGVSDDRGFVYSQPFFWNISKHRDLTLSADLETQRRVGGQAEYRYAPRKGTQGLLRLQYFNENIRGNDGTEVEVAASKQDALLAYDIPTNRASAQFQHRQEIGDDIVLYGDALMVSDELFLREVDSTDRYYSADSFTRRTRRYTTNRFGAVYREEGLTLGARSRTFQDIDLTNQTVDTLTRADSLTLQRPIEFWGRYDGDYRGFGYEVDGSLTQFVRRLGEDGQRFDTAATVSRNLTGDSPIRAGAWVRGRFTAYNLTEDTVVDDEGVAIDDLDATSARGVFEAGMEARTTLARVYNLVRGGKSTDKASAASGALDNYDLVIDHVVEPFAGIRYTSSSNDADLPLFDGIDRIDGRTTATYGVLSRFHLRDESPQGTTEAARFSISQSYNFDDEVIDDHFSDIDFLAAFRPIRGFSVTGLASYNVGARELSGATSAVSVRGFRLPYEAASESRLEAVYRFVRAEAVGGAPDLDIDDLESVEGRVILGLTDRLSLGFNGRYDVATSSAVEQGGGLRIESACDCWAVEFGFTSRVNPNETQLRLRLELAGLGNLGASPLRFNSPGLLGLERGETGYWRSGW